MLTSDPQRLETRIVQLLAERPQATASWIHSECNSRYRSCSVQGVYHELRKLQTSGIVVKARDSYSLSLSWAFEFVGFADTIYDNYVASASHLQIIPENQSSISWRFSNLLKLDDVWIQAMIALFGRSRSKQMFCWTPHPWFYFAQKDKVMQFYRLFLQEKWHYYSTIGGTTLLDRHYAEGMNPAFYHYRLGEAPVFDDMSLHSSLIGDYLITVKLDQDTSSRIEDLFQSIGSLADATYQKVSAVLNTKGKLQLKIEHNPSKAGRYSRKYKRYFGV